MYHPFPSVLSIVTTGRIMGDQFENENDNENENSTTVIKNDYLRVSVSPRHHLSVSVY
jgi:hypothetical protein